MNRTMSLAFGVFLLSTASAGERAQELLGRLTQGDTSAARSALLELRKMGEASEQALLEGWQKLPAPHDVAALQILVERKSEASMSALEAAAKGSKVEAKRLAAAMGVDLKDKFAGRVVELYARLVRDNDVETSDGAAGSIRVHGFIGAWQAVVNSTTLLLGREGGESSLLERSRALGALLAKHPSQQRVDDILAAARNADSPRGELVWMEALAEGQTALVATALRELLAACYTPDQGASLRELGFTSSVELRVLLVRGLAADPEAVSLIVRALRDGAAQVRVQALRALRAQPLVEPGKSQAVEAVIPFLTDPDMNLRKEAHRWLQQVTKQKLPLALAEWRVWADQNGAKVRLQGKQDAWAKERGHASFGAFLKAEGYKTEEEWLRDQGYETWERFLRDEEGDVK